MTKVRNAKFQCLLTNSAENGQWLRSVRRRGLCGRMLDEMRFVEEDIEDTATALQFQAGRVYKKV